MIRPIPRTGHIKRCDVKAYIVDQKSALQWMQLKVTVNLCPPQPKINVAQAATKITVINLNRKRMRNY